jgi:PAS domain S-box-containing protein
MLSRRVGLEDGAGKEEKQAYGDLSALNTARLILDAVGPELLRDIVNDYLDLLETSAAVNERNGDYAFGVFASGWCRFMDHASRRLCGAADNRDALAGGCWHCHESCWTEASKRCMELGEPVDIACRGGLRLFAVPIRAGEAVVGSINCGYGDPPRDPETLATLAARYQVGVAELQALAGAYPTRPPFIVALAKRRLLSSARLIGEIVQRRILERRQQESERAVRENESLLRSIFRAAPVGIGVVSNRILMTVNDRICEMTGYPRERLVGQSARMLYPSDADFDYVGREKYRQIAEAGSGTVETRWQCRDGRIIEVLMSSTPIHPQDLAAGVTFTALDITARKRAEAERARIGEQLLQAQKMESVGRLAGGVAHDFNNMLGVILGHAELGLMAVPAGDPIHRKFKDIQKAAERSAELTRQLLAFARRQTVLPRVLDLNETLEGMIKMLQRLIGEEIDLLWKPGADLWRVHFDPSQIDQVLANLCVNARDAIAGVGKLTIETHNTRFDAAYCAAHPGFLPGHYVLLAVSDDGRGMDPQTLEHIFEPFYTTKEVGKGTGLGLATVYGIVKQNEGFINVYSEPGKGSTFKIYLPRFTGDEEPTAVETPPVNPMGQGETILVVEDEGVVLQVSAEMLAGLGYTVLAAGTAGEALRRAEAHAGVLRLLITDVVMPEMNGRMLAAAVQRIVPGIRCLFTSGYTANVIAHRGVLDEGVHFLQKPFSLADLAVKVRQALAGESAPLSPPEPAPGGGRTPGWP